MARRGHQGCMAALENSDPCMQVSVHRGEQTRKGTFQPNSRASLLCIWEKLEHVHSFAGMGVSFHPLERMREADVKLTDQNQKQDRTHVCEFCFFPRIIVETDVMRTGSNCRKLDSCSWIISKFGDKTTEKQGKFFLSAKKYPHCLESSLHCSGYCNQNNPFLYTKSLHLQGSLEFESNLLFASLIKFNR